MARAPKALVVGARGLLGSQVTGLLRRSGYETWGSTPDPNPPSSLLHLDLREGFPPWLADLDVEVAVIAAGIGSIRYCEANPDESFRINVTGRVSVAQSLMSRGVHVVLISTDAVYSGDTRVVSASQATDARTVYGRHMAQSEIEILHHPGSAAVVRLGKVVQGDTPILRTWSDSLRGGRTVTAFFDSRIAPVSPGYAVDTVGFALRERLREIVHATAPVDIRWSEVADVVARKVGVTSSQVIRVPCVPTGERRTFAALPTTHELPTTHPNGMEAVQQAVALIVGES